MTFVLLVGLKLKKYHFCQEISDLEQGETLEEFSGYGRAVSQ